MLFLFSCISTTDEQVRFGEQSSQLKSLKENIGEHSQKKEVIKNFETHFIIRSTYLAQDILEGIAASPWHSNLEEGQLLFKKTKDRTSFVVSMYALDRGFKDLKREALWDLSLQLGSTGLKPVAVERLSNKDFLKTLFPGIDLWSNDYLISFEVPKDKIDKNTIELNFSNPKSKVAFSWLNRK